MKRIDDKYIIISEFTSEDVNSTGYFWHHLITYFKSLGHTVEVVSSTSESSAFWKKNPLMRVLAKLWRTLLLSFKAVSIQGKSELLISGTNPEFLLPLIATLKSLKANRWCVVAHDIFPATLIAAGVIRDEKNPLYRFLRLLYSWAYRKADLIVVIGRDMEETLVQLGVRKDLIVYIPNWVSLADVYPLPRDESPILKTCDLLDKFVFQFFGNLGRLQDLENLLNSIALLKEHTELGFLFIGDGARKSLLEDAVAKQIHPNLHYIGAIPQAKRNLGLNACDVAIVPLKSGVKGLAVPSKFFFSMAANRPILAVTELGSEMDLIIRDHDIGWVVNPSEPRLLADKILAIAANGLETLNGCSRNILLENFSQEYLLRKFSDELDSRFRHQER